MFACHLLGGPYMANIVVIDDDRVVLQLVEKVLEIHGHTTSIFEDAQPVLETANLDLFDAIVTDLAMPTSGEILIRTLRSRNVQIPILVMSGHIDEEKATYLISLGANAVVRKPFTLQEFMDAMQTLI